jgi:Sulfotransferase domain
VTGLGQPLVVVDAGELCRDPSTVVSAWCKAMDLPFLEEALSWEPGMRGEWDLWKEWHSSTARATGFRDLGEPPPPPTPDDPRLYDAYQRALPVYERLAGQAIRAAE